MNATLILTNRFRDGKPQHQWIRVVSWRGLAKRMTEMAKGSKVRVWGRLETARWQDAQTGEWKHRLQIVADRCEPVTHLQAPPDQAEIDQRPITDEDLPF